jgi:CRISPR-associated protein Cmr6
MAIAAVPHYLGTDFNKASPGLRFGMYLQLWDAQWDKLKSSVEQLKPVCKLTPNDVELLKKLAERQKDMSTSDMLMVEAKSIAPFTTGLGNEHPTENGFAFLNPYGLPYLPGSGVKGVLRQAARKLADGEWGETSGWNNNACFPLVIEKDKPPVMLSMLDVLFGRESQNGKTELIRGALSFWDVIPQLAGNSLAVDIMTPHQSHYYQGKAIAGSTNPHESGQPNPISFLTVPPKSGFVFYVQCDTAQLPPELENWRDLLDAAFQHAFDWLGFGAKTSVGYGAMQEDPKRAQERATKKEAEQRAKEAEAAQRDREALPPDVRLLAELDEELDKLPRDPRDGTPIKQATSTPHWQTILRKLQEQTALLDGVEHSIRETVATEVKKRLMVHFRIEGRAEKAMKTQLAALKTDPS